MDKLQQQLASEYKADAGMDRILALNPSDLARLSITERIAAGHYQLRRDAHQKGNQR